MFSRKTPDDAEDKFTIAEFDEGLRRRGATAKASLPKAAPENDYPNADRYGEDGRRLCSAYDAATVARRPRQVWVKLRGVAALILLLVATLLIVLLFAASAGCDTLQINGLRSDMFHGLAT
ncbi:hypothetical protein EOD23_07325 [Mesorhizobium sp. USDA-HM6]|nr:hypothetical protein EOD23_07325 [Mesorhizobium sp. USDA-HM6]